MATFRPVTDTVPSRASDSPFAEAWSKIEATTKFAPKLADIWTPQPGPQEKAYNCESYELLYGGAAFGGKSEWLLHDGLKQIAHPQYKALLLRRTFPELRELIDRSFVAFKKLDGTWNEQAKRWSFPSGATYQFGYCENYSDVMQYQGQQFAWIGYDELGQCTEERIWTYLMSRNRAPYAGLKTYMRSSANPGGPGHHWLKRRFIENCPPDGTAFAQENGITRSFIQAFMRDNIIGLRHDPAYATRLEMLPEVEYKWLAEGDWSAGAGMGLSDLQRHKHLVEPYNLPRHWTSFGAFDWGYNHPFYFGLFVCDEDGNVILVDSVQGRRLQPDQIAARIIETMEGRGYDVKRLSHIHAGHDCWADRKARGELVPTIAEQFYEQGLSLSKANISRISGVQNMRRYLRWRATDGTEIEPRFRIFKTPSNLKVIECLESRVSDPDNIEDILKTDAADNGEGGDDAYDMVRYGLASRPMQADAVPVIKHFERFQDFNEFDEYTNDKGPLMQYGSWV